MESDAEMLAMHLDEAACAASNAARGTNGEAPPPEESWFGQAATMLRALSAENAKLTAENNALRIDMEAHKVSAATVAQIAKERGEARDEVARLTDLLEVERECGLAWQADIARLTAALAEAQRVPAGWRLVPSPTKAMIAAAQGSYESDPEYGLSDGDMERALLAAIAAAPQPPAMDDGWRCDTCGPVSGFCGVHRCEAEPPRPLPAPPQEASHDRS